MRRELHAEWTKLRTVTSTAWLLLGTAALTIAVGAAVTASITPAQGPQDVPRLVLGGVQLGQATVVVLACMAIGAEYGTGTIRPTLVALPRRLHVYLAKALIVAGLAGAAGVAGVLGSALAGRLILPAMPLSDGPSLRAAYGTVIYLVLVALLSLGLATALRDSGIAIVAVLSLLYAVPILARLITSRPWQHRLDKYAPMHAGLSIQATENLPALPLSPWHGLGLLGLYALTCLALGAALFRLRDA